MALTFISARSYSKRLIFQGTNILYSVSDPYHLMRIRIRIRGSVSGMMDPDPGLVLDPDPDPDPT